MARPRKDTDQNGTACSHSHKRQHALQRAATPGFCGVFNSAATSCGGIAVCHPQESAAENGGSGPRLSHFDRRRQRTPKHVARSGAGIATCPGQGTAMYARKMKGKQTNDKKMCDRKMTHFVSSSCRTSSFSFSPHPPAWLRGAKSCSFLALLPFPMHATPHGGDTHVFSDVLPV